MLYYIAISTRTKKIGWEIGNGLIYFNPKEVKIDTHQNFFVTLHMNGQSMPLNRLKLPHDFDQLKVQVHDANFQITNNRQYKYRINGHSKRWHDLGPDGLLEIIGLAHGNYTLEVMQLTFSGDHKIQSVDFKVTPIWYQSVAFKLGMLIVLILTFFLALKVRSRQLSKRAIRLQQEVDKQKAQLEEQNGILVDYVEQLETVQGDLTKQMVLREKLLGMISHDVMGSLYAMNDYGSRLTEKIKDERELSALLNTSKTVYKNMRNILNWVKTQRDELVVQHQKVAVRQMIDDLLLSLEFLPNYKLFTFLNTIGPDESLTTDEQMIRSIVHNLIENQIKHSKPAQLHFSTTSSSTQLRLEILNTDDRPPNLDELASFLTSDDLAAPAIMNLNGGFGMILTKELMAKLDAKIIIKPSGESGHLIQLQFPIEQGHS